MSNNENIISTAPEPPETAQSYDVEAELIRTLYQQAYTALIGVVAKARGIAAVFFNEISNQPVAIWLITIYVLSFVRYLSIKKFKAQLEHAGILRWGQSFAFFAFIVSVR